MPLPGVILFSIFSRGIFPQVVVVIRHYSLPVHQYVNAWGIHASAGALIQFYTFIFYPSSEQLMQEIAENNRKITRTHKEGRGRISACGGGVGMSKRES